MASSNDVSVKISADSSEFRKGASDAKNHVDGLLAKLKDFKTEQVQQSRTARFFASQIAEIIPGADGASASLRRLIEVGLEGSAMGAGFQLAAFAIGLVTEQLHEQAKVAMELRKVHRETAAEIEDAMRKIARELEGSVSKVTEAKRAVSDKTREMGRDANAAAQEIVREQGTLWAGVKDFFKAWAKDLGINAHDAADQVDQAFAKVYERIKTADGQTKIIKDTSAKEDKKRAKDTALEVAAIEAGATNQIEAIKAQLELDLEKIRLRGDLSEKEKAAFRVAYERKADEEISRIRLAHSTKLLAAEAVAEEAKAKFNKDKDKAQLEDSQRVTDEQKKQFLQLASAYEDLGRTFGEVFNGMMTGTTSVAKAFATMAAAIIRNTIQLAIVQIKANAGIAGAEAASSQAMIPFAGPFLAIAALAAVEGAVLGLLSLVSAAGGYDIPMGVNPVVQAHGGEMILPADIASPLRASLRSGGGGVGGTSIVIHASALDRRWWDQHKTEIVRTIRDATREGRFD